MEIITEENSKKRGRPIKMKDNTLSQKQIMQQKYYRAFRQRHQDNLPAYYRKPNAVLGRPTKQHVEGIKPCDNKELNDGICVSSVSEFLQMDIPTDEGRKKKYQAIFNKLVSVLEEFNI